MYVCAYEQIAKYRESITNKHWQCVNYWSYYRKKNICTSVWVCVWRLRRKEKLYESHVCAHITHFLWNNPNGIHWWHKHIHSHSKTHKEINVWHCIVMAFGIEMIACHMSNDTAIFFSALRDVFGSLIFCNRHAPIWCFLVLYQRYCCYFFFLED